jgi:hypothetical protein
MQEIDLLKSEMREQEVEDYVEGQINWLEGEFYDSWDKIKGHFHKVIKDSPNEIFPTDDETPHMPKCEKWFFLSHQNDTIRGKPQLVEDELKTIPLIRLTAPIKEGKRNNDDGEKEKYNYRQAKYTFFDERYDKRYDGAMLDCFSKDFWIYQVKTEEGKKIYIWSQEKLPNCTCTFKGMLVELDDFADLSRNLKIKSLSKVFFMKSFEPDIKILSKEQLIKFTSERKITENLWFDFLAYHKFGTYNRFTSETEWLKSSWLLSGKVHDYPFHLFVWGGTGLKKTCGFIETTSQKFGENFQICEGGSSRLKGLIPNFKEYPANPGYLINSERIAFIDEIGKMIESESVKTHNPIRNFLGEINPILEHKKRVFTSGNNNSIEAQATSKTLWASNPVSNNPTIYSHIGLIDPTTLSRGVHIVLDEQEKEYVLNHGVEKIPREPTQAYTTKIINKKITTLENVYGGIFPINLNDFLSLFDSCYSFTCEIPYEEVEKLVKTTTSQAREPMKTSVWLPRAEHHIYLLIDGLVKTRCLFRDYDPTFTPIQEDYDLAERILVRMVKSWDTDMSPKGDRR